MVEHTARALTIGIVTHNRAESLRTCLASLAAVAERLAEVIVVDDTGDVPLEGALGAAPVPVRLIRQSGGEGYIVARNRIVREAATEAVLLMDDDAALIDGASIETALALFDSNPAVAAIAFSMADRDGSAWHPTMQPAPVDYACYVGSFIGFAHLLRRSLFLRLSGYREAFHFYGEEKDYCLRAAAAGFDVVYLPQARVMHAPDPTGRDAVKYARYTIRNDCLFALYNEPLPLPLVSVPIRLARYSAMSRGLADRGGFAWILKELARLLPRVVAERRPVSWTALRRWRRVARTWPAFA